jgi:TolB-like protein
VHHRRSSFLEWMSLCLLASMAAGCAKPYLVTNFDTVYQPRTRVFAIAPIANLSTEPEGATAGQAIREAIYYELSRREDQYTVAIQDIAQTDERIHAAGLTDSAAALLPGPELSRIVGADAVMRGSVTRYRKKGAAGQVVTAVLFGFAKGSEVKADVAIYDGTDGRMIWQHNIEKAGGIFSSPDALRNAVGATVAKKFPYKKKS